MGKVRTTYTATYAISNLKSRILGIITLTIYHAETRLRRKVMLWVVNFPRSRLHIGLGEDPGRTVIETELSVSVLRLIFNFYNHLSRYK